MMKNNVSQATNMLNLKVEHGKYLIKLVLPLCVDVRHVEKIRHSSDWIY